MVKKLKPEGVEEPTKVIYEKKKTKKKEKKVSREKEEKKHEKLRKRNFKLAQKFAEEVVKKFKKIVKSVIVFGSTSRGDVTKDSDIDLLVIFDDTAARFTPEMKEAFDEKLQEIGKSISKKISVQPAWSLTEFWDMARIGHPLLYTIVRDGWALYDDGFFIPVRKLLEAGKIPHTIEAIELLMESAPKKIERAKNVKLYMIAEDLYYAMLNSSQAVLMFLGKESPTPKNVCRDVKEYLVDTKLLPKKYLRWLEQVIKFRKDVEHKKVKKISGEKLDKFIEKAEEYVRRMQALLGALERRKKEDMIKKNYEVMLKGAIATLKSLGKLPEDPKELPKAIKKYLIGSGKISPMYEDVLRRVITMRKMIDEDETDKIPQRDVEMMREYVRRFIRELSKLVEEEEMKKACKKPGRKKS